MKFNKLYQAMVCSVLCAASFSIAQAGELICSPSDFGGVADSNTLNTQAIQSAINKCAKEGGVVSLSAGTWLSGPIVLLSNTTLRIEEGAILKADNRNNEFVPAYIGSPTQANEAFLLATNAKNVTIEGKGIIDGNGAAQWWPEALKVREAVRAGNAQEFEARFPGVKLTNGMPRPWLIEFNKSSNITVKDVLLTNSPMWNLVIRNSSDVVVDGLQVVAPVDSPNTDGIDIVSSKRVTVRNADIFTGDDNVAIKSGVEQNGADSCEQILIQDSVMHAGHGVSIGSETANGIGAVQVINVKFDKTENGIRIKSARDRGNKIGPLYVENVDMQNVETPILLTCSYAGQSGATGLSLVTELDTQEVSATTPFIHSIEINGLKATGAKFAALLSGLPESPIKGVALQNIDIESQYGIQARYVEGSLINSKLQVKEGEAIVRGPEALIREAR